MPPRVSRLRRHERTKWFNEICVPKNNKDLKACKRHIITCHRDNAYRDCQNKQLNTNKELKCMAKCVETKFKYNGHIKQSIKTSQRLKTGTTMKRKTTRRKTANQKLVQKKSTTKRRTIKQRKTTTKRKTTTPKRKTIKQRKTTTPKRRTIKQRRTITKRKSNKQKTTIQGR